MSSTRRTVQPFSSKARWYCCSSILSLSAWKFGWIEKQSRVSYLSLISVSFVYKLLNIVFVVCILALRRDFRLQLQNILVCFRQNSSFALEYYHKNVNRRIAPVPASYDRQSSPERPWRFCWSMCWFCLFSASLLRCAAAFLPYPSESYRNWFKKEHTKDHSFLSKDDQVIHGTRTYARIYDIFAKETQIKDNLLETNADLKWVRRKLFLDAHIGWILQKKSIN